MQPNYWMNSSSTACQCQQRLLLSEEEGSNVRGWDRCNGASTELHESERAARDAAAAASGLDVEPAATRAARDAAAAATRAA
jgi:hypothetical protein